MLIGIRAKNDSQIKIEKMLQSAPSASRRASN